MLNLTLLVQSKAQDRPFQGENAYAFHYLCDQRDLDMWLSGNAPVILVFSHLMRVGAPRYRWMAKFLPGVSSPGF